jgi:hypothetical protein
LCTYGKGIHAGNVQVSESYDELNTETVNSQVQLMPRDKEILEVLALSNTPVPSMKRVLHLINGRFYDGDLLYRFCKNVRNRVLGTESQSIQKLLDLGTVIKENGGRFLVQYCEISTKIIGVHIQHKIESDLVQTYGKRLFYLDGTHNTTRYVFKAVPPQSIDCFGYTCPLGLSLIQSESHDYVRAVLRNLGLSNFPGCTVITDRAPAWSVPLQEVKGYHIYDSFHFNRDITSHSSNHRDQFMKDMRKAVFFIFHDEEQLNNHLSHIETYATGSGLTLLQFLKAHVRQIALTYTSAVFTGSWKAASSRGEGFMSKLKGKGSLKKQMSEFSLFELGQQHKIVVNDYVYKVRTEMRKMLFSKQTFTPNVQAAFNKALSSIFHYRIIQHNSMNEGDVFIMERTYEGYIDEYNEMDSEEVPSQLTRTFSSKVIIPTSCILSPTCTCRLYTQLLLPCGCMAKAFASLKSSQRMFLAEATLHDQWKVSKHPMYNEVVNSVIGVRPRDHGLAVSSSEIHMRHDGVSKVPVPKNTLTRKSKISCLAEELSDMCMNSPILYQRVMHDMHQILVDIKSTKAESQVEAGTHVPIKRHEIGVRVATSLRKANPATQPKAKVVTNPKEITEEAIAKVDSRNTSLVSPTLKRKVFDNDHDERVIAKKVKRKTIDNNHDERVVTKVLTTDTNKTTAHTPYNHETDLSSFNDMSISPHDTDNDSNFIQTRTPVTMEVHDSCTSSPSISDPNYINKKLNQIRERRKKTKITKSSSSSVSSCSYESMLQRETIKFRKQITPKPSTITPCSIHLHYKSDKVEEFLYAGDTIIYYEAIGRFGDDRFKREDIIVDIIQNQEGEVMLKMMNNWSFVYAHQMVCKIKDVTGSMMEKKMCFLPLDEFNIEENKNNNE